MTHDPYAHVMHDTSHMQTYFTQTQVNVRLPNTATHCITPPHIAPHAAHRTTPHHTDHLRDTYTSRKLHVSYMNHS